MPLDLQRIDWMPSPPLAPEESPIDFAHLARMTLGDAALEREVLTMFAGQSAALLCGLRAMPPDAAALAHTLKGSARAVGAMAVADAAERFEQALAGHRAVTEALGEIQDALTLAQAAIDAILM